MIFRFALSGAVIINIPADYSTIQQGINAGSDGDTALVQPGTYVENINFNGHNVVLGSLFLTTGDTSYVEQTVIDGNHYGSVVIFGSGEDSRACISGFTITHGTSGFGGGIACYFSSPTITHNIIINNSVNDPWSSTGAGILCQNSNAVIHNNVISNNSGTAGFGSSGGGIACSQSGPVIINNIIRGNISDNGGGISCYSSPTAIISGNLIAANVAHRDGGGLSGSLSSYISNNVIFGNTAMECGGGIYYVLDFGDTTAAILNNNILWSDSAYWEGNEICINNFANLHVSYCDIEDTLWPGFGNISIAPLFRDIGENDFHLMSIACGDSADSPCIDAGDPNILDSLLDCSWGLGDPRSDMGAYGGGDVQVSIDDPNIQLPEIIALAQNYPNPFNPATTVKYALPKTCDVSIEIYDILGRRVQAIVREKQQAGYHSVVWNADGYSSGMYFYRIEAGGYSETKKMVLIK